MIQSFNSKINMVNKYTEKLYFDAINEFTSSNQEIILICKVI